MLNLIKLGSLPLAISFSHKHYTVRVLNTAELEDKGSRWGWNTEANFSPLGM